MAFPRMNHHFEWRNYDCRPQNATEHRGPDKFFNMNYGGFNHVQSPLMIFCRMVTAGFGSPRTPCLVRLNITWAMRIWPRTLSSRCHTRRNPNPGDRNNFTRRFNIFNMVSPKRWIEFNILHVYISYRTYINMSNFKYLGIFKIFQHMMCQGLKTGWPRAFGPLTWEVDAAFPPAVNPEHQCSDGKAEV